MKKNITPLSFLKVDGKLEGKFPMLLSEPIHDEEFGSTGYEEIVAWPPEDPKDVEAGSSNFKTRVRLP